MDTMRIQYSIFIMGDVHTVTAFKISGYAGQITCKENAPEVFDALVSKGDIGILLITHELAGVISKEIKRVNFESLTPVIIEIPAVDDTSMFNKSILSYITEALGIAI